jgi:transposase-like protein
MARKSSVERRRFWQNLVAHRQATGRSVAQVCAEAGVSKASFFAWQKRLRPPGRKRGAAVPPPKSAPPHRAASTPPASPLVPVRIVDDRTAALVITLPGAVRVELPAGCDEATLRRVLRVAVTVQAGGPSSC